MSCHIKILASILLLFQISIITSHPVVNEREQKQQVFYRDSDLKQANSSVIREENALHRNADSSNRGKSTFLSLLSEHARVARSRHGCVKHGSEGVFPCGDKLITTVSCQERSFACYHRRHSAAPRCKKITSTCRRNGALKVLVTDCECL